MTGEKIRKNPAVSVCMPCYNAALYLRESIESILNQTYENFELLIVDDGSTDNSVEIIHSYQDKRIRLICAQHDYIRSLNILLKEANGKYIARMDADDLMMPERLMLQYYYLEQHPDLDLLAGGIEWFGEKNGMIIPEISSPYITLEQLVEGNIIAHPTVMIRKSSLDRFCLCYRKEYIFAEDYRLWVEMLQKGLHLDCLPNTVVKYRLSGSQVSTIHTKIQQESSRKIQQEIQEWLNGKNNKNDSFPDPLL